MITWTELATAEPRLSQLEETVRAEAERAKTDSGWSFSRYWSFELRPALRKLVGWERPPTPDKPQLLSEEAWHVAISHLIALLPEEEGQWAS